MSPLRIQQLSALVANQIAAGEVIERPASVVKELLENALDAGADTISIDIGFGGLNQVKISDNGAGILAADLPLAIAAHATSKIRQLSDLYTIASMGFRGEALASIAAVSRLSISSKPATQEHAMMLRVDGSSAPALSPCARSQGTTVDAVDLFYNAPVRKKFLKTVRSEFQAIEVLVKRFALSAPWLALTLKHDGKQIFSLPAARCEKTRELRIRKLLGKTFIENAVYLDVEQSGMRLMGWVSAQSYQRSQNDKQWVYLNQRMVKDKLINHAVKQAYEDILHPGRYPACLIYLTIPAGNVDVNVHPTKHEVRFQQPRLVHDFITSHISEVLGNNKPGITPAIVTSVPKTTFQLEVREHFIPTPLQTKSMFAPTEANTWHILNTHFGLVFLQEQPYLVDLAQAQQHWLLSMLSQHLLPLASRPLLVPMIYKLERDLFEQYQLMLIPLGIELDLLKNTEVVVRTIPILLPQLDIKKFLQGLERAVSISSDAIGMQHLLELLISCQSFDARQLTDEDQTLLTDHLRQFVLTSSPLMPWCVKLDTEKCREITKVSMYV